MIGNECSQPRWNCCGLDFLQVLLNVVGQTGFEDSQARTQDEEVVFGDEITWPRGETCRLKRSSLPWEIPGLEDPQQEGVTVVSTMRNVQGFIIQTDVSITIFPFLSKSLLPGQQILKVSNGSKVEELFKLELKVEQFFLFDSRLISSMHVSYLVEVVSHICPKRVILVACHHLIHKFQLVIEELLDIDWRILLSFEVQSCEIEES